MLHWTTHHAQRHRLLGLALLLLQPALVLPADDPLRTAFILLHFALVLLWQPFFERSRPFNRALSACAVAAGVAIVFWGGWLVLAAWLLVLLGLIGGESPATRRDGVAQWLAITHLFVVLMVGIAPGMFDVAGANHPALDNLLIGASLLPMVMLAIRGGQPTDGAMRFDHLRSPGITLLTLLLAAGAVLWSFQTGVEYPLALIHTLPTAAVVILVFNWIWQRASTHSMIQLLWNRYLLNLGTPFEQYLMRLSGPGAQSLPPGQFLDHVVAALSELEWVAGVEAQAPDGERRVGDCLSHPTRLSGEHLSLTVYTRRDPSPALRIHIQLLLRLAHQLWDSRRREAEMESQARVQALYETGARLAHDTKNLLQSLQSLTAAVKDTPAERAPEALDLVKRQLPPINQRLHATLEKLREPADEDQEVEPIELRDWWEGLQARYADNAVRFSVADEGQPDGIVPRDVLDTVLENLLENSRYKQRLDRSVKIETRLSGDTDRVHLEVIDTGEPMPEHKARVLFNGAVESTQGLGVGLYQAARLARHYGYELALGDNDPGRVRFTLTGPLYSVD